jgi:phage replication initiation protein
VDWLNATFKAPALSQVGFVDLLGRMLNRPVFAVAGRGLIGFCESLTLHAKHGSVSSAIGSLAWGGEAQKGRWLLQLTGVGCQLVRDWEGLRDLLESLDAKLTRVDLAVDYIDGAHTVDEAIEVYQAGGFQLGGRPPSSRLDGDWLGGKSGRTFYVGNAKNGKMLRVYEKGKQLGDSVSDWTRFEVQLGNRDRVIPFDVLTERDAFFCGCYPALAEMLEQAGKAIATARTSGVVSIAHLLFHLRRCYGKVLHTCSIEAGASNADLIEELRLIGLPRRVSLSSVAAGVIWSDVIDQFKRYRV